MIGDKTSLVLKDQTIEPAITLTVTRDEGDNHVFSIHDSLLGALTITLSPYQVTCLKAILG
jgi:hypothetical protein